MKIKTAQNIACPIEAAVLTNTGTQLRCSSGHTFDIARQGHINLLTVQQKRSKDPGDSKAMVVARTALLNTGLYQAIATKINALIEAHIVNRQKQSQCLFDAGCGEGYYLESLLQALKNNPDSTAISLIGLDISKHAIAAAAKRSTEISWLVGSNRQPPVLESSVDIILCVFGFQNFEGFNTILKSGGLIILVEPGPDHLKELREIIYAEVKKTDPPDLSIATQLGFSLSDTQGLQYQTGDIDNDTINNLLLMTPHFFRANQQGRDAASNLQKINLTIDIVFRILKKQ